MKRFAVPNDEVEGTATVHVRGRLCSTVNDTSSNRYGQLRVLERVSNEIGGQCRVCCRRQSTTLLPVYTWVGGAPVLGD